MRADGFLIKQIAEKLYISERTVTTHQENIYKKLNIHHKACLLKYASYYPEFLASLTGREKSIVLLMTEGQRSQQIAFHLNISIATVYSHRKTIHKKLSVLHKKYDVLGIADPA